MLVENWLRVSRVWNVGMGNDEIVKSAISDEIFNRREDLICVRRRQGVE